MPEYREFVAKRDILGELIYVSYRETLGRGLNLDPHLFSRVVLLHEIHELITTDETAAPGDRVSDVSYVGFFEIRQGGSLRVGDVLRIGNQQVGELIGFDLTHYPNHFNLVVRSPRRVTGRDLAVGLGEMVRFSAD